MHLDKGKLVFSLLLVCYVVFLLVDVNRVEDQIYGGNQIQTGDQAQFRNQSKVRNQIEQPEHFANGAEVNRGDVPWSKASLSAQGAPPMALLLTRVQHIHFSLLLIESRQAEGTCFLSFKSCFPC